MAYVVSFVGYRPIPRFDGTPWTEVRIGESASQAGPFSPLETKALSPVDTDPKDPQPRSFTTELATLAEGWYQITFADASGDTQPTTPIFHTNVDEGMRPTVDEVAILLRTRTVGGLSTGLGADTGPQDTATFTATTRPSAIEVERLIDQATAVVNGQLDPPVSARQIGSARHAAAVYTAILIESSFFRERDEEHVRFLRDLYQSAMAAATGQTTTGTPLPKSYGFGTIGIATTREYVPPSNPWSGDA